MRRVWCLMQSGQYGHAVYRVPHRKDVMVGGSAGDGRDVPSHASAVGFFEVALPDHCDNSKRVEVMISNLAQSY
jgi:hypothetical protein